ncbi:PREDICTED: SCAN domain-containing protein 1-like [Elephantulus edwardii]|uniref:SCAN domain-containing protein 1-like n=1 Tax=Elephantulus edwardii TaxID=28737 RepID=UPI0003F0B437|nr:PREDICTED: SCAN domain-containing protein 1-like [Elephantulus edwardii]
MEIEGNPGTKGNGKEVHSDQIASPTAMLVAEEPEVLIPAPQVQFSLEPAGLPSNSLEEDDSVKDLETIPRRNPPNPGASLQRFRQFRYEKAARPRDVFQHLQDLAMEWLRPDIHTKEQIVEMLVREQFQAILPEELRARLQRFRPGVRITG